ncbi:MAG: hypothetical protein GEU94_11165 [Micromonosporaceae bacterium]|nr:hypothetical protein [Micromonosporaceae bacterium]
MPTITVPKIHCPLPSAFSPHAEAAESHVAEWATRFGLSGALLGLRKNRVGHLSAYVHPQASAEAVKVGAVWTAWLFAYDDLLVEPIRDNDDDQLARVARVQSRILAALSGSPAEPAAPRKAAAEAVTGSIVAAARDIRSSILAVNPSWEPGPFIQDLSAFLCSNLWEIGNSRRGRPPRIGVYLPMRRQTSAFFPSYRVSAALASVRLPREVSNHLAVRELENMACNYGSWLNDLFSFEREQAEGGVHSLVRIVQREHGCGAQEAAEHVADMCRTEIESYLELKSRLPEMGLDVTGELKRHLALLESWMSGVVEWYQMSPRYNERRHTSGTSHPASEAAVPTPQA